MCGGGTGDTSDDPKTAGVPGRVLRPIGIRKFQFGLRENL